MSELNWFIPGPTQVNSDVLKMMSNQIIGHRSLEYAELQKSVTKNLKRVFITSGDVFVSPSSATGLMEGALRSCVNTKSLHMVNGAFSKRWFQIAEACDKIPVKVDFEWGKPIDPDALKSALLENKYEAVFLTHNETSTGVMSDIKTLTNIVREISPETLVMVDVVSSLAGAEIRFEEWGIDYMFASVQKCLALPPGFSVLAVSDRALKKAQTVSGRGMYFDILTMKKYHDKNNTFMTPSTAHLYALDFQLKRILDKEGLENRWARHFEMQQIAEKWASKIGIEYFSEGGSRSVTVSAFRNTFDWDLDALILSLKKEEEVVISNGYGPLKGQSFRIGHMGEHTPSELRELLLKIENRIK